MTGGTRSWRLAGLALAVVAIVGVGIGVWATVPGDRSQPMPLVKPKPRPTGIVINTFPEATPVVLGSLLAPGHYKYDSQVLEGRRLYFFVPEGLQLLMDSEGGLQSEQAGLVLVTPDGRSWLCLSVLEAGEECGRDVARGAEGLEELFDRILGVARDSW